jgi:ubiquinone/menaquinone biosynthesis C-methylase UbiE
MAEHLEARLEFQAMDALSMLEFPFNYLDLVSIQMGGCTLRTWEWGKLLLEFQRVTRPGGVIRVVEQDFLGESTSPALNRLTRMLVETFYRAGHLFHAERTSLLSEMPRLFQQFGIRDVQVSPYMLEFRATTPGWSEYASHVLPALTPFMAKWGRLPEDYDELCQQALTEMMCPNFVTRWRFAVTWGHK